MPAEHIDAEVWEGVVSEEPSQVSSSKWDLGKHSWWGAV